MTNTNNNHSDYDDDTDSDDELGAMIYRSSRTAAKLRAEEAARNIKEDESKPKPTHKRGAHTFDDRYNFFHTDTAHAKHASAPSVPTSSTLGLSTTTTNATDVESLRKQLVQLQQATKALVEQNQLNNKLKEQLRQRLEIETTATAVSGESSRFLQYQQEMRTRQAVEQFGRYNLGYDVCQPVLNNGQTQELLLAEEQKRSSSRRKCSVPESECPNRDVQGGVCISRGAKRTKCSVPECPNRAVQGGVCISHGAKRKTCNHPGCTKNVKQAGMCSAHGPARKRCEFEGCIKVAVQGGRCISHGGKTKVCSIDECTKGAVVRGMCKKHYNEANGIVKVRGRPKKAAAKNKQQRKRNAAESKNEQSLDTRSSILANIPTSTILDHIKRKRALPEEETQY